MLNKGRVSRLKSASLESTDNGDINHGSFEISFRGLVIVASAHFYLEVDMSEFYDYKQTLSRQAAMNFIVGERGLGKTYGFLKYCVERFIKKRKQFIYLRRFQSDVERCRSSLFDHHLNHNEFGEHIIEYKNGKYYCNGQVMGYILPLTKAAAIKSTAWPDVETIIFDEFLLTSTVQHYLRNEPFEFASLCDSIFRERDPKIFLLGNASTITNPYFEYFRIKLDPKREYQSFKNGLILVHYSKNLAYREKRKRSKFGQLMSGTSYEDYAIENKFCMDSSSFILKRPANSWLFACLYLDQHNFGLWIDREQGRMFVSTAFDPGNPRAFALTNADHNENLRLASVRSNPWVKLMLQRYREGLLFFESQSIKNHMIRFLEKYL